MTDGSEAVLSGRFRVESISEPNKITPNNSRGQLDHTRDELTETTFGAETTVGQNNTIPITTVDSRTPRSRVLQLLGEDWNERGLRLFTLLLFSLILMSVLTYYVFQ